MRRISAVRTPGVRRRLTVAVVAATGLALAAAALVAAAPGAAAASPSPTPSPSVTTTSTPSPTPTPVSGADADAALSSFDRAFYVEALGVGQFKATTESSSSWTAFWRSAELFEMVEDAYQHSGRPLYRQMIAQLRRGVLLRYGTDWTDDRKYNDDILWMVLAFIRVYETTGNARARDVARQNFDAVIARGWSDDLGGGLWWTTDGHEKNACVNGPGAIAAFHLYEAFDDPTYLQRAVELYAWMRDHLFNPDTGAVFDHVSETADGGSTVNRVTYTYNQGTFIGAAALLHLATGVPSYFVDALQAFAFAQSHLTQSGILRPEGTGSDGGGFKGIFARYAVGFGLGNDLAGADVWFDQNAEAAWSHKDARGLMGQDWTQPTPLGKLHAFDCSSAVVLMQQLRP